MTLLPRSLVGRVTVLVAVVSLLSLVVHATLWQGQFRPIFADISASHRAQALLGRRLLASAPAHERAAVAARISDERMIVTARAPQMLRPLMPPEPMHHRDGAGRLAGMDLLDEWLGPDGPHEPPAAGPWREPGLDSLGDFDDLTTWLRRLGSRAAALLGFTDGGPQARQRGEHAMEQLRFELGPDTRVWVGPPQMRVLSYEVRVDGQPWWFTFRKPPPASPLTMALLAVLGSLVAMAGTAVVFGVVWISRPLSRFAEQLARQGSRLRPLTVDGHASTELKRLAEAFNRLVAERTQAHRVRQQLLAGVSHDLRTPLARLRLRVETQVEPAVADALSGDLRSIEHIVEQFLAYVKGDVQGDAQDTPGAHAARGEHAPLCETVAHTLSLYPLEAGLQAELEDVPLPLPDLAVQRLVTNLVDNALAHGAAPVAVRLCRDGPGGLGARLTVSDAGPGMSEEEFALAQQPFVRLQRQRSNLGHCGLGLAIVAQIAAQLQARLETVREPGGRFGIALVMPRARKG